MLIICSHLKITFLLQLNYIKLSKIIKKGNDIIEKIKSRGDGTVDSADIILLNKYLLSKALYPIREDLKVNVDIDYDVDEDSIGLLIMFCKRTGKNL